jgi:hypothetical protein
MERMPAETARERLRTNLFCLASLPRFTLFENLNLTRGPHSGAYELLHRLECNVVAPLPNEQSEQYAERETGLKQAKLCLPPVSRCW